MAHTCNPSTQETEAEGSQLQDQTGIHSETLSQKQTKMLGAGGMAQVVDRAPA
jgi:hypothetical protein